MAETSSLVMCEHDSDNEVVTITLNNPKVNALSRRVRSELHSTFTDIENEWMETRKPSVVIIRGIGRGFSAGADLNEVLEAIESGDPDEIAAFIEEGHALVDRVASFPIPVVAVLHGFAGGGGKEIALACDWRIALPDLHIGFPEVRRGFLPGWGGTVRIMPLLKRKHGHALLLTMLKGGDVDADGAMKIGLVDSIAPSFEEAKILVRNRLLAGRLVKKKHTVIDPDKAQEEKTAFAELLLRPEAGKRIREFFEKNNPEQRRAS